MSIEFSVPTAQNPGLYSVFVDAALQPNSGYGPDYYLQFEADASDPFFASETPDALPITLNMDAAGADMIGGFSIAGVQGRSSGTNLLFSTFNPGAVAPEPTTQALAGLCIAFLLVCLKYRQMSLVRT